MIRTLEEIRTGAVTITITVDDAVSDQDGAVDQFAESSLTDDQARIQSLKNHVDELLSERWKNNVEMAERADRIKRLEVALIKQHDRAERTEARLHQAVIERDMATRQLSKISGVVHRIELSSVLGTPWTDWLQIDAGALTSTIWRVRSILGTSPEPADATTSQA